jgi:hypothetical protein
MRLTEDPKAPLAATKPASTTTIKAATHDFVVIVGRDHIVLTQLFRRSARDG